MDVPIDLEPLKLLVERHFLNDGLHQVEFAGLSLVAPLGVFCPTLTKTSSLMLECVLKEDLRPGVSVLDVFSGTGVFGVLAATRGCRVVAVDISPLCASAISVNAKRNGTHLDVRTGNVFEPLADDESFDLIIASPPLLPGTPSNNLELALLDPGYSATRQFIVGLRARLAPGGASLIILSDVFERSGRDLTELTQANGLKASPVLRRDVGYEVYTIFRLESL